MFSFEQEVQTHQTVLKSVDALLANPDWEQAGFLRALKQQLTLLRDKFEHVVHEEESLLESYQQHLPQKEVSTSWKQRPEAKHCAGQVEIFVSLYCANGDKLNRWERILSTIEQQSVNRPLYKNEADAKEVMRAKQHSPNEGYAVVTVDESCIQMIPESLVKKDKWGNELVQLTENAIHVNHIVRFVHVSGEYQFNAQKKLVK